MCPVLRVLDVTGRFANILFRCIKSITFDGCTVYVSTHQHHCSHHHRTLDKELCRTLPSRFGARRKRRSSLWQKVDPFTVHAVVTKK